MLAVMITVQANAQDLAKKASTFLQTLSVELKAKAQFEFTDAERFNWHFIPIERKGPSLRELNQKQRSAAVALLRSSLSDQGYKKASGVMELENVLIAIEKRGPEDRYRDPLNYHILIFGEPSSAKEWGWRFEGHHLSLNFSSASGTIISSTPSFFGSNPGTVPDGENKGLQVLKTEMELGFLLVNSLDEKQLKEAVFADKAPSDIITGNSRKASLQEPHGIHFGELKPEQQKIFLQLLDAFVKNYASKFSETFLAKIKKAGLDELHFAWAGSLKPGSGHYYRIQGPVLLIEYDNTQNDANHVHTVVRDLTNDFGEDILRDHYDHGHQHH